MSRIVKKAKFVGIERSKARLQDGTIGVVFNDENEAAYDIQFDAPLIGRLMILLASHMSELVAKDPDLADFAQPVEIDAFGVSTNDRGEIALEFRMTGGAAAFFQFSRDQFEELDARMSDARAFLNRSLQ